jgi:CheY-like chemotaxis protein
VSDTGIGIAPQHLETIFEEFGQIDSPTQRKVKGTGLGLTLSRKLAELLSGTLTVVSTPGQGSTFTLAIPVVHPEVREMRTLSERPLDPTKAPVLVVEDDRKTIFIYEKYLAQAGFQVVPARTIEDAQRILAGVRPAAVVLDVMLDGESSWSFLAEVKRNPETADIPVMVVTVTNKERKARALGADEFWLKPIDQERLLRKVASLAKVGSETRVLVIDDDDKSRYIMRRLLEKSRYQLAEAASGPEGVELARRLRPSVIFLDFLLKDITAFDVIDDLKADPITRAIPIIVVTSQALGAAEREQLSAHTEAILSKESLSRELAINRIRDALKKAGLGAQTKESV